MFQALKERHKLVLKGNISRTFSALKIFLLDSRGYALTRFALGYRMPSVRR